MHVRQSPCTVLDNPKHVHAWSFDANMQLSGHQTAAIGSIRDAACRFMVGGAEPFIRQGSHKPFVMIMCWQLGGANAAMFPLRTGTHKTLPLLTHAHG